MVRVLDQLFSIGIVTGIARVVGPHALLQLMIGIGSVHGMTTQAAHLAFSAQVAL